MKRLLIILLVLALSLPTNATIYYAQSINGNIDDAGKWDSAPGGGGTVLTWPPAVGDILAANGKTGIAINVDVTCLRLSTADEDGASPGVAGGGFTVAGTRTVNANLLPGSTDCIVTSGSGYTLTVVGNVTGSTTTAGKYGINNATAVALIVTGNVSGGSQSNGRGILNNSTGAITVTGNVTGGSAAGAQGINNASTGAISITGNATAGSSGNTQGVGGGGTGTVTLTNGNIINTTSALAIAAITIYNPGPTNYIEYPKPASGTYKYGLTIPAAGILSTATPDGANVPATGTYHEATEAEVQLGVQFGPGSSYTGTYAGGGGGIAVEDIVLPQFVLTGHDNYVGGSAGTYTPVAAKHVKKGVQFGAGLSLKGTFSPGTSGGIR
jgi:hypothetical protein